ncbi:MAG: ABC transporter ATP-binding protein [Acidimicrobiia bacterium]|nr:ABC transporter ATP-binding protein [Acidimicrobiia bacterium]MYG71540.1 ABC transporter ATP-binding protein [Acidimicrobiia bacterium]
MQLEVAGLISGYGKVTVLHGVDLKASSGEIVVVLGPNGAGKTTLMKTIAGHLPATGGTATLGGHHLAGLAPQQVARLGVGYVPQDHNVFRELTVRDNLRVASLAFPDAAQRTDGVFDRFPILAERASQRAATLSGGERQTLAVSCALIAEPKVLLLDEPTAGLAPLFVGQMVRWVSSLAAEGMAVVWVVEQSPEKILAASARACLLEGGRSTAELDSGELLAPGHLQELLLEGRDKTPPPRPSDTETTSRAEKPT